MHNSDLKVIFADRPNDSVEQVAQELLDITEHKCVLGEVVDTFAFLERCFENTWAFFLKNPHGYYYEARTFDSIDMHNVAQDYIWSMIEIYRPQLEMIVALKSQE